MTYIRNLPPQPVVEEEPGELSGETFAPNASEALLAAFGSCLAVGIHANAVAQGIPIRSLTLDLAADLNTTAVWGTGNLTPHSIGFEAIRVSVQPDADAPHASLKALMRHATLFVAGGQHAAQPGPSGRDARPGAASRMRRCRRQICARAQQSRAPKRVLGRTGGGNRPCGPD